MSRMIAGSNPLVSVIIPAYNHGAFINESVDSALRQDLGPMEIIVIDDGSIDHTPSVMEKYNGDARIRHIRQQNAGAAAARNRGIEEARGDFIAFLDADDIWEPDKLASQLPLFSDPRVGCVYAGRSWIDENGERLNRRQARFHRGHVLQHLFIDNFICFSSVVVRRSCLERAGGFDETLKVCIDYDLLLRLSIHCCFDFVSQPLVRYRIGHEQISLNKEGRYINTLKIREKFLSDPGVRKQLLLSVPLIAKAKTFTHRGEYFYVKKGDKVVALKFYVKALLYYPFYFRAWKNSIILFIPPGLEERLRVLKKSKWDMNVPVKYERFFVL